MVTAALAVIAQPPKQPVKPTPPRVVPLHRSTDPVANTRIKIVVEGRGTIIAELYKDKTPKTTAHILKLIDRKFYDHLLFHSVVRGFMAVTGDPKTRSMNGAKIANLSNSDVILKYGIGSGGSGSSVPLEPGYPHVRGALGLQRNARYIDSGDSQFFFDLADNFANNAAYCVFGQVTEGLDVMDKIRQGDRISSVRVLPPPTPSYLKKPWQPRAR